MSRVTHVKRPVPTVELLARAAAASVLPDAVWGGGTEVPTETLERKLTPDAGDLKSYEEVCGFAPSDELPVTYPHILGFPLSMQLMTGRSFPMPVLGLVHVNNTITVHEHIGRDQELMVRVHAEGPRAHHRGAEVDLITEAFVGDSLLWSETSTYLARGSKIGTGEPTPRVEWPLPTQRAHVREVRIGGDIGRRYGSVSGDRNPIHIHPLTARAFGFKRAIAHGMWTLANSLAVAGVPFEPPYRVSVTFRKPVFLPTNARLLTATEDGQLRIWLTGSSAETIHVIATVDKL